VCVCVCVCECVYASVCVNIPQISLLCVGWIFHSYGVI